MSLYIDTSALLKLYIDEPDSDDCEVMLAADPDWATGRHTLVEARRNLRRLLGSGDDYVDALAQFTDDWQRFRVIDLDADLCLSAAQVAERTGARTLDALHLAAATASQTSTMVTYDRRLARAARDEDLEVANPGQSDG